MKPCSLIKIGSCRVSGFACLRPETQERVLSMVETANEREHQANTDAKRVIERALELTDKIATKFFDACGPDSPEMTKGVAEFVLKHSQEVQKARDEFNQALKQ
jgi:hypothetical protein